MSARLDLGTSDLLWQPGAALRRGRAPLHTSTDEQVHGERAMSSGLRRALKYTFSSFDAVLLDLILSVVPDGALAFREAWRVLKPGGRAVIFDKFLPKGSALTPGRRLLGRLISVLGTDPNRRLGEITDGTLGLTIERDEPSLLRGQYRILRIWKGEQLRAT